jgi:glycosyltransferase involved in cell wall biosynthesis
LVWEFFEKAPCIYFAFKEVVAKYPNARLVLGGQGSLYEVCKNLVSYYNLEAHVFLPGILSKKDFLGYLENGLAFVQHSVTAMDGDQEGTPVAILEASAAGLPVISTKHAGIPDIIIDGETGLLVAEHDVAGMAEKMMFLLENMNLAKKLGAKGKERVSEYFTQEKHLQIIDSLIDKSIDS